MRADPAPVASGEAVAAPVRGGMAATTKEQRRAALAAQIRACRKCEGMNVPGVTQAAPGYGSVHSRAVLVGQSLCFKCMATQIPFTGGSGRLIDRALTVAGIDKCDVFITNVVHCHPPGNRSSRSYEIDNCTPYLRREIDIVSPRLVIGVGKDAEATLRGLYSDADERELPWPFKLPRKPIDASPALLFALHPSAALRERNKLPEQQRERYERDYVSDLARALRWAYAAG